METKMTFMSELKRLREAATKGPWTAGHPISKEHYGVCAYNYTYGIPQDINDSQLIAFLVNRAEAIEELVRAADDARGAMLYRDNFTEVLSRLTKALAKLEVDK